VFAIDGTASNLESRVVLPLPRKPVTTVTGFLSGSVSLCQGVKQGGVERVERATGELLRRGPQGSEVLNYLGAALFVVQEVFAPTPVLDPEAVVAQNLVRQCGPVDAVAAPVALVFEWIRAEDAGFVLDVPVRPVDLRNEVPAA
jgi:hypothetical protein